MLEATDVAYCEKIMRQHGVSYAFATRWFPPQARAATAVLYAFFRVPDDLVDDVNATDDERARTLKDWCAKWQAAQTTPSDHPVLRAAQAVFAQYKIPYEYGDAFLAAMQSDLTVASYQTYADLERYMYGSAAVVGLIMSHVIGFKNAATLDKAKALGEAMQLTNFLRDLKEDFDGRGRIYLPAEDLARFDVSPDDFRTHRLTPNVIALLKFEIKRARDLYACAETGIDELAPGGRFAVRLASRLYAAILNKIEQADYSVFKVRAHTSLLEKIFIALKLWLNQASTR